VRGGAHTVGGGGGGGRWGRNKGGVVKKPNSKGETETVYPQTEAGTGGGHKQPAPSKNKGSEIRGKDFENVKKELQEGGKGGDRQESRSNHAVFKTAVIQ